MGNKFIMKVSTAELSNAIQSINAYDGKSRLGVEKALQDGAKWVANGARQRVAVRSGKTKRSIKNSFSRQKLESYVKATTHNAHLIEFGTRPHKIRIKRKKVLVIEGGMAGKEVMHPGTRARPFMRPAFEAEAPNITKEILKVVQTK